MCLYLRKKKKTKEDQKATQTKHDKKWYEAER